MIGSTILETLLWGLQVQQWIVIAIILATFLVLMFSKVRPDMVFVCTIMALNITGVLSVEDSFSGLANSSVVVVGIMCGVIAGLKYTGALGWMVNTLMGRPKTHGGAIVKMMVPAAFLSAFTSNTATTLLFEGAVKSWARELRLAPSKLLIPLAYAASIGGMLTMLGSPCNLIILGQYQQATGESMNLFAPFPVAICCLALGIGVVVLCKNLLPTRKPSEKRSDCDLLKFKTSKKTIVSGCIMVAMIILSALDIAPLTTCSFLAALFMVICKCCSLEQVYDEIEWNVLLVFAGSISIGTAVAHVGLDTIAVNQILKICGTQPYIVLAVICLYASILTEMLSDTATAALAFPIAYKAATTLGLDPYPFCLALVFAASNNYSTPIATPPNTIVYMSGGYKFLDFARIGLILKVVMLAAVILLLPVIYPF